MDAGMIFNDFVLILVNQIIIYWGMIDLTVEYVLYHIEEYIKGLKRG